MGIQFGGLVKGKELEIKDLSGKKVAIDAFNWIFQFLSTIRQHDTGEPLKDSKGRITSHLSGLFYRNSNLLQAGIRPVYVFDGQAPAFKAATQAERRAVREEAHAKWQEAKAAGDMEAALKAAKMSSSLNSEMIQQSKDLLDYMGIQVVQAPSEGEAQCAQMCRQGVVHYSASQDWDSILFGSPRLVRNLNVTGRRKMPKQNIYMEVKPEIIEAKAVFDVLDVTREQLIIVAMLIGTDFNPGVKGYGPKRALELVKKEKTLKNVISGVQWIGPPAEEVFGFFMHPPAEEVKIEQKQMQPEKLMKMMVDEHEFSQERVEKVIKALSQIKPKNKGLGSFM
ncbi:MAG TPA: flap endonuclease-1 [archaeon]|nr:flap endonuclease-1 [archaeon]